MLSILLIDGGYEGVSSGFKPGDLCVEGLRLVRDAVLLEGLGVVQA